jgi:hypothetical protein
MSTYTMLAQLGDWTFWTWEGHPFEAHEGRPLYGAEPVKDPGEPGKPNVMEWQTGLDRCLLAAVCGKYTGGQRGAGGPGVGTAADWVARMIGMDALTPVDYQAGQRALQDILHTTQREDGPLYRRARAIETELEKRGLVIAAMNHGG